MFTESNVSVVYIILVLPAECHFRPIYDILLSRLREKRRVSSTHTHIQLHKTVSEHRTTEMNMEGECLRTCVVTVQVFIVWFLCQGGSG